jgi:HEAT repeat protein
MTLYIARAEPIGKPDPRAARWVRELDDDSFPVREKASRALGTLGDAALPVLREALDRRPTLEQRRRIERLINRLRPIHLSRLKFPKGVRVVSLDALVKEAEKNWRSGQIALTYEAASGLAEWAEYSEETFGLLVEALRDDREQVRDLAQKAFARLGHRGAGALAALKAAPDVRAPGPRDALKNAIRAVGEETGKPGVEEYWRQNRRLRAAIAEYCRSMAK